MPGLQTLGVFFGASVALALSPGPDILFVVAQSVEHGRRAGLCVTAGLCTGLIGHTAVVALGAGEVLTRVGFLLPLLKGLGAAYLCHVAWQSVRHANAAAHLEPAAALSGALLYRRGVVMNLTNPKVTLFFLALLPQFVDAEAGRIPGQLVLLGGVFMLAAALVFGAAATLAGGVASSVVRSHRTRRWLHYGAAAVLVALALRLLLD